MKILKWSIIFIMMGSIIHLTYLYIQQLTIKMELHENMLDDDFKHSIYRQYEIILNGKFFYGDSIFLDQDQQIIPLSKFIDNTKLVLYYSELDCNICIDQQIEILNDFISDKINPNIIILVESTNSRYFRQFKIKNKINCPIYRIIRKPDYICRKSKYPIILF